MSPVDGSVCFELTQHLYEEAALLDEQRFEEWLDMLAPEVRYRVPVRSTARRGTPELSREMYLVDDDLSTLGLRIRRLATDVAWAEDPPSRTRHHLSNVRVTEGDAPGELAVRANLFVYRNRGGDPGHDLISAERHDIWRRNDAGKPPFLLVSREVLVDQATLGTKNLAVFL